MNEEDFEDDVYARFDLGGPYEWETDGEDPDFTEEYNAFVRNDCVGIIDYDKAVELYKFYSGSPDSVTEWPEIDAIQKEREALREEVKGHVPDDQIDDYVRKFYPFEPVIKFCY